MPVYLILGFLDGGKTSFIMDTLAQEYFNDGSTTLILACEDGETEYDEDFEIQTKSKVAYITDQADFNTAQIKSLVAETKPDRIFIEYNGMWPMSLLSDALEPTGWELAQVICLADGGSFAPYLANMRSMAVEMFKVSDMLLFNRCLEDTPRANYRRIARAANPRIQVGFEAAEGVELSDEDELPYALDADVIDIEDGDYAIFHMDAMEKPERYEGKIIHFKAQFCKTHWGGKNTFVPGRFAMVCCANDVQFIGYLSEVDPYQIKNMKNRDWIEVTAQVKYEQRREYDGVGPVLHVSRVVPTEKPAEEVVYF